jgi:hypothetical protein
MQDFNKNILKFSDLMNEIWKIRETCFIDLERSCSESGNSNGTHGFLVKDK